VEAIAENTKTALASLGLRIAEWDKSTKFTSLTVFGNGNAEGPHCAYLLPESLVAVLQKMNEKELLSDKFERLILFGCDTGVFATQLVGQLKESKFPIHVPEIVYVDQIFGDDLVAWLRDSEIEELANNREKSKSGRQRLERKWKPPSYGAVFSCSLAVKRITSGYEFTGQPRLLRRYMIVTEVLEALPKLPGNVAKLLGEYTEPEEWLDVNPYIGDTFVVKDPCPTSLELECSSHFPEIIRSGHPLIDLFRLVDPPPPPLQCQKKGCGCKKWTQDPNNKGVCKKCKHSH
jgi:hypothetical protein